MSDRILVIGANGMLGGSIHRYFSRKQNVTTLGTVRAESVKLQLARVGFNNIVSGVDVINLKSVDRVISEFKPTLVLNCIGLIKQLSVSKKPVPAIEINALLPHRLAELCNSHNTRLIHFSTDCVFSGERGMYKESDRPDAMDIYGRSKLLGEVNYEPHITLRTSIIGHELNSSVSLIDWFLSQSGTVKGFTGAFFSGLPTVYVAKFIDEFILPNKSICGLQHLSAERIDKYSLLNMVKEIYDKKVDIIADSQLSIDRSLDSSLLRETVGFCPPSWPSLVEMMYQEYAMDFKK